MKIVIKCSKCKKDIRVPSDRQVRYTCPGCGNIDLSFSSQKDSLKEEPARKKSDFFDGVTILLLVAVGVFFAAGFALDKSKYTVNKNSSLVDYLIVRGKNIMSSKSRYNADIAKMLHYGYGISQDCDEAEQYYLKSGMSNDIGEFYFSNSCKDHESNSLARKYWMKMAGYNEDAMYNMGRLYEGGHGVDRDYDVAISWYKKAKAEGHKKAGQRISGLVEKRELAQARYEEKIRCAHVYVGKIFTKKMKGGKSIWGGHWNTYPKYEVLSIDKESGQVVLDEIHGSDRIRRSCSFVP